MNTGHVRCSSSEGLTIGNHKTIYGRSSGLTLGRNKPISSRGSSMSLCLSLIRNGEVYLAADSRLSDIISTDSHGNILQSNIKSDDFQKLFVINETTALFQTGQGEYCDDNRTFADVLKTINFTGMTLPDIAKTLNDSFAPLLDSGSDLSICIFSMETGALKIANVDVGITVKISEYIVYPPDNIFKWERQGMNWTSDIIENIHEEDPVLFIKTAYKNVYKQRDKHDFTIGGPVRILKLTSNGYEWIEKGLIIEQKQ